MKNFMRSDDNTFVLSPLYFSSIIHLDYYDGGCGKFLHFCMHAHVLEYDCLILIICVMWLIDTGSEIWNYSRVIGTVEKFIRNFWYPCLWTSGVSETRNRRYLQSQVGNYSGSSKFKSPGSPPQFHSSLPCSPLYSPLFNYDPLPFSYRLPLITLVTFLLQTLFFLRLQLAVSHHYFHFIFSCNWLSPINSCHY